MSSTDDEFEGIDISGPWGGVRIGSGRGSRDSGGDPEFAAVRRRIRRRLEFFRHLATFVFVVGFLALVNWATGGDWWVIWVAAIWGAVLVLQFFGSFVGPSLFGREAEERMVRREMERRRGRVSVIPPDGGPAHREE